MQRRHHKFSKRETFYGTKNERSEVGGLVWPVTRILLKGKDYNRKLISFTNILKLGDVVSKLVQLKRTKDGAWGKAPSCQRLRRSGSEAPNRWVIFCIFLEKIGLLLPFRSHFASFQSHLKKTKFLRFESQLKKSLPLLQIKSKTRSKSCILGLNFVIGPGQAGQHGTLPCATFLALNNSLEDLPWRFLFFHKNN